MQIIYLITSFYTITCFVSGNLAAVSNLYNDNILECQNGDVNIATFGFTGLTCDANDLITKYVRYLGIRDVFRRVNSNPDLAFARNNITFGYVFLENCWKLPVATEFVSRVRTAWEANHSGSNLCEAFSTSLNASVFPVTGVVGGASSENTGAMSSYLQSRYMWQISSTASSDTLADRTKHPFLFRMVATDSHQAAVVADILVQYNWTYVIVLFDDTIYGRNLLRNLQISLNKLTVPICIAMEAPLTGPENNYIEKVVDLILSKPNAKVIVNFGRFHAGILEGLKDHYYVFIGSDYIKTAPYYTATQVVGSIFINFPAANLAAGIQDFNNLTVADIEHLSYGRQLWKKLHGCCFDNVNSTCPSCSLFPVNTKPLTSKMPLITDKTIDAIEAMARAIAMAIEKDCQTTLPDIRLLRRCLTPEVLAKTFTSLDFIGLTGRVIFEASGEVPAAYIVRQQLRSAEEDVAQIIGTWNRASRLSLQGDIGLDLTNYTGRRANDFRFPVQSQCSKPCGKGEARIQVSQCCWTCLRCRENERTINETECKPCPLYTWPVGENCVRIPPTFTTWTDALGVIILLLSCLGLLVTLPVGVFYIVNREASLLKASSVFLSVFNLCGLLLAYCTGFFFLIRPSLWGCLVRHFLYHLSVSMCYASLLVKTFRIFRVFAASRKGLRRPNFVGTRFIVCATISISSVKLVLLVILTFIYSMEPQETVPNIYRRFVEVSCPRRSPEFWIPVGINMFLIAGCCVLAFRARSLPDNFHDAKCIFACAASSGLLWFAFIPSLMTSSSAAIDEILTALVLLVTSTIMLSSLFLLRIYAMLFVDLTTSDIVNYGTAAGTVDS